jgi:hypothetical protein
MKQIGLFTDLHADKRNLDLIVRTFRAENVDSTLFLGDALFDHMSNMTLAEKNKATNIREALRVDSEFRADVLDGLFTDDQLDAYLQGHENAKAVGKKVARAEYKDIKAAMSGLDFAVLGGNWDYGTEMQEVFGDRFLNGTRRNVGGLNVMGFSGGGSPAISTATTETLADNKHEQGTQYEKWARALQQPDLNANIMISHVPFTDGEGVEKEMAIENLKAMVIKRKAARRANGLAVDDPGIYMWGHRHGKTQVKYDAELDGFTVMPGTSSRNHNHGTPNFSIADFDNDKKLVGVTQYAILSSLTGMAEVRKIGYFKLDYASKNVKFTEMNEVVLKEDKVRDFDDNLELDASSRLSTRGLNVNYNAVRESPRDLELLVRQNYGAIQNETKAISKGIRSVFDEIAAKHYFGKKDIDLDVVVRDSMRGLEELAAKVLGADYEALAGSDNGKLLLRGLVNEILGVNYATVKTIIAEYDNEVLSLGSQIMAQSSKNLSEKYEAAIFEDLNGADLQAMAELHMPANYKRVKDLEKGTAFRMWRKTFNAGVLTSKDMDEMTAYKVNQDFVATKRTKEKIADKFGFSSVDPVEDEIISTASIPERARQQLKQGISSGALPVFRDSQGDYIFPDPRIGRINLDENFASGLDYKARTQEEELGQGIRDGRVPVVNRNGKDYAVMDQGGEIVIDHEKLGIGRGDYNALTEQQFIERKQAELISQKKDELRQLEGPKMLGTLPGYNGPDLRDRSLAHNQRFERPDRLDQPGYRGLDLSGRMPSPKIPMYNTTVGPQLRVDQIGKMPDIGKQEGIINS